MGKSVLAICIILALAVMTSASAAPKGGAKVQWWPGERPTPNASGSLSGQISAITDTTLSVQTEKNGTPIFTVNKDTVVKGAKISYADLKVGDKVEVRYTTLPDDNVWAKVVVVASSTPPVNNSVFGRVAGVTATAITITTEQNVQQTYNLVPKTKVWIKGVASTIDQVKIGDPAIIAFGATTTPPVARNIRVLAEGVWPRLFGNVSGKVGAIDASSITVQTEKNGPQTFGITEKTKVFIYEQASTLDQIKVGNTVSVGFKVLDDGTRVANQIAVPVPTYRGKIASAGADGFVLAVGDQTVAFAVSKDTKITSHVYTGTVADLVKGYSAVVRGIPGPSAVQAFTVEVKVPVIKGAVVSASGSRIVVKNPKQRIINVSASSATVVLVRPRTAPNHPGSSADVQPGATVNIGGHVTGPNTITALWIDVLVP